MSDTRDIVCFANDWAGDPLSKKHVMRRLARTHRVLWVDSLGNRRPRASAKDARRIVAKLRRFAQGVVEVEDNIWVMQPLALPVYGSAAAARINAALVTTQVRAAMQHLGFRRVLNYTFVPASAWVAGRLGEDKIVYHCVDEYSGFAGAGADIAELEASLLARADLVVCCSQPLVDRKRLANPRTHLVRHGVDHAHFATALDEATAVPDDIAGLPRPIVGFYGLVEHWIDLALLGKVADAIPGGSLVIVGETRVDLAPLLQRSNVHVLGRRPYASLPGYCRAMDVALLPFVVDDLTVHANPLKLREYLAAGLPVVATDIPEARALAPAVTVAADDEAYVRAVRDIVARREAPPVRKARSDKMTGETWDARVAEIERLIASLDEEPVLAATL